MSKDKTTLPENVVELPKPPRPYKKIAMVAAGTISALAAAIVVLKFITPDDEDDSNDVTLAEIFPDSDPTE